MAYANIPDTGLLLDGTPWAGLSFAEGPTLHFKPAPEGGRPWLISSSGSRSHGAGRPKGLAVILVVFPVAAACSMAERKVCAWIQRRPGPNRALPPFLAWIPGIGIPQRLGLFQLAADGAKFLFKEEPLPDHVNKLYYTLAPVVAMVPAFTTVTVVPFGAYLSGRARWSRSCWPTSTSASWPSSRSPRSASTP
jgi:hypothetical protein